MKSRLTFVVISLLALSLVAPARGQWEVQGGFEALFPSDDFWDEAVGGEVKAVYWTTPQLGFAVCTGVSQWGVDGGRTQAGGTGTLPIWQSLSGDGQYVPLGVSILMRDNGSRQGGLSLGFEAGLRVMFGDSDMTLTETTRIAAAPGAVDVAQTYDVDLDDGLVARVAANLSCPVGSSVSIFLSGGYQFDVDKGDASMNDIGAIPFSEEVDLSAFFIQLGALIPLN